MQPTTSQQNPVRTADGSVVIDTVETMLVDLPTIRLHKLSMATMSGQTLMIVRIRCSDGTVGIGEGTTIGGLAYGGESPEGMKLAIDTYFAPQIVGANANRVPALMAHLNQGIRDNRFAKCAVETALFDALGHRTSLPVSELLGGRLRDRLPVAWTLASGDTGRDIEEAQRMLETRRQPRRRPACKGSAWVQDGAAGHAWTALGHAGKRRAHATLHGQRRCRVVADRFHLAWAGAGAERLGAGVATTQAVAAGDHPQRFHRGTRGRWRDCQAVAQ